MKKLYIIDLSPAEREELTALVEKETVAAYRRRHAQILLLADQGGTRACLARQQDSESRRGHPAERRADSQARCAGGAGGRLGAAQT